MRPSLGSRTDTTGAAGARRPVERTRANAGCGRSRGLSKGAGERRRAPCRTPPARPRPASPRARRPPTRSPSGASGRRSRARDRAVADHQDPAQQGQQRGRAPRRRAAGAPAPGSPRRRACPAGRHRTAGRPATPPTRRVRPRRRAAAATAAPAPGRPRRHPLGVQLRLRQRDVEPVVEVGQPGDGRTAYGLGPGTRQRRGHLVGDRPHLGVDPSPLHLGRGGHRGAAAAGELRPSLPRSRWSRLSGSGRSRDSHDVTGQPVARRPRTRVAASTAVDHGRDPGRLGEGVLESTDPLLGQLRVALVPVASDSC